MKRIISRGFGRFYCLIVSIHVGHPLDVACMVLGPFTEIAALLTTQYAEVTVGDDAKCQPRVIPDHLLLQACLA